METVIKYGVLPLALLMSYIQYYFIKRTDKFPKAEKKAENLYLKALPVVMLLTAIYMIVFYKSGKLFLFWKEMAFLSILWVVAYVDYKCQLIFNEYLLMALGIRGLFLIVELFASPELAIAQLLTELIGVLCLLGFGFVMRFLSRKGMGMGDIKLLAIMPLFLGTLNAFQAVLYSMIIIFVQACVCLITHKKGRKDALPFAPAILGGAALVIFFIRA